MKSIDAHQHFWIFDPVRDSWINDEMSVIQRDFLPVDLAPVLLQNGMDGCIAVQADQSEEQNHFLLDLAANNHFIKGVVGWVDLHADNLEERLQYYQQFKVMKGFRHVLQGEANRALMLEPDFKRGISQLAPYGYTYDILIFPDQLKFAAQLAIELPNQQFVLDHIAKPYIKDGKIDEWAADLAHLAKNKNVYCKLSGMVTEANWHTWTNATFTKYLDVVFEAFGTDRVMFGSDWPVCLVAASYPSMKGILTEYVQHFSPAEKEMIFGGNAIAFYNL
jgi:L-fuconolactonase